MRVQIHLNLANPEAAENVVRIQSPSGAWVAVGYATALALSEVVPVVSADLQERVGAGDLHKVPHAYLEGTLEHFEGRRREKAPARLLALAQGAFPSDPGFRGEAHRAFSQGVPVNYNPRFARCFYADHPDRSRVTEKFLSARRVVAVGWRCVAKDPRLAPMPASDRLEAIALARTSGFERLAIARGIQSTLARVEALSEASHAVRRWRR